MGMTANGYIWDASAGGVCMGRFCHCPWFHDNQFVKRASCGIVAIDSY